MILIAPTAFKGTISASEAAQAIARGVAHLDEIVIRPLADGGNGLIDAILPLGGELVTERVSGPLQQPVDARILLDGKAAVIESADACGLHLVPGAARNPMVTTTIGVGELLLAAAKLRARVFVGLGGSATVDGGIGFAHALGWRFFDAHGDALPPVPAALPLVRRITHPQQRLSGVVVGLADVTTPLSGPHGAARVFGPQKGADPECVEWLDHALDHFGRVVESALGVALGSLAGGGAAGGLGAALCAFADGRLESGSDWVMERLGIDDLVRRATLIITGEGSYDDQSTLGKITGRLIECAGVHGRNVLLIAGAVHTSVPPHVRVATGIGSPLDPQTLEVLAKAAAADLLGR